MRGIYTVGESFWLQAAFSDFRRSAVYVMTGRSESREPASIVQLVQGPASSNEFFKMLENLRAEMGRRYPERDGYMVTAYQPKNELKPGYNEELDLVIPDVIPQKNVM